MKLAFCMYWWCCSVTQSCPALRNPMDCSMTGFPDLHYFLELAQTYVHWVGDNIHPTISSSIIPFSCFLPFPVSEPFPVNWHFASGGQIIGASVSASVLPTNIQDLFPFRIDWLDLLAVQGTVKSLLQHHSLKASILPCSAFFMVQLSMFPFIIFDF